MGLYSTLLDEDNFRVEDGEIILDEGFLKEVQIKQVERGEIPTERFRLDQVRNKILEKVKMRKDLRVRRDSISSMSSVMFYSLFKLD